MTQNEIDEVKSNARTIRLETHESVVVQHKDLPTAVVIIWRHDIQQLLLNKATDKAYLEMRNPIDLDTRDVLILNYEHRGHERIYKLQVDKEAKRIEFIKQHDKEKYALVIQIVDRT